MCIREVKEGAVAKLISPNAWPMLRTINANALGVGRNVQPPAEGSTSWLESLNLSGQAPAKAPINLVFC
jgi:hypothetical protein